MEMYLKGKGLWEVVAEDVPISEENKFQFQKAHSVIVLHLEDSQLLHVVHKVGEASVARIGQPQ